MSNCVELFMTGMVSHLFSRWTGPKVNSREPQRLDYKKGEKTPDPD